MINQENEWIVNAVNSSKKNELGITQEYNKENRDKLWDSAKGKEEYKDKVFGNQQTYRDPVSGKLLHKSQTAAQKKYHMRNAEGETISAKWAEHSAETDHINSLKDLHNIEKHNPFLSDADFREIANSDANYRILSKRDNTSKGAKSDWKVICDKNSEISTQGKLQMVKEKVRSDVVLHAEFSARTAQNIGKEFAAGATDTVVMSVVPLTAEAIRKTIMVVQGEESVPDALEDMEKIVLTTALGGGMNRLAEDAMKRLFENSTNPILYNLAESNEFVQIIAIAAIVQESAVRYINGEIDGREFVNESGAKGTVMVAGMIGGEIGNEIGGIVGAMIGTAVSPVDGTIMGCATGKVIGEILGTILTSVACGAILSLFSVLKEFENYKIKEKQIRMLEAKALEEMRNQRLKFRKIVEREFGIWDETIQAGFDQMLRHACKEAYSLQEVMEGLGKILSVFGKEVRFKNLKEYEQQLNTTLKLSF